MSYLPILEVIRGGVVESIHSGAFVVSDPMGEILHSWGSKDIVTFLRSSAKPFQIIPLIEEGGEDHFGLTDKHLAIICASHSGTDEHMATVRSIQESIGVSEADLCCGSHPPSDTETRHRLIRQGKSPSPLRHNCSGKHSGMMALSILIRGQAQGYTQPDHPVQERIWKTIAEMFDLDVENIETAIDGCSVPTFAVPLFAAARAFATLADPQRYAQERERACRKVWSAMTGYPGMVAGEGKFDTALMRAFEGSILAKGGAEGYQAIAISPGTLAPESPGLGIALKIADGDLAHRARSLITLSILKDLGIIQGEFPRQLAKFGTTELKNWRGLTVGHLRPAYKWRQSA